MCFKRWDISSSSPTVSIYPMAVIFFNRFVYAYPFPKMENPEVIQIMNGLLHGYYSFS